MSRLARQLFKDEQVNVLARLHWIRLLGPFFLLLVLLGVAATAKLYLPDVIPDDRNVDAGAAALAAFALGKFAWSVFVWRQTQFVVTSRRLIGLSGGLRTRIWSVPLANIGRASVWRSIPGRILGFGDVGVYAINNVYRLSYATRTKALARALTPPAHPQEPGGGAAEVTSDTQAYTTPPAQVPSGSAELFDAEVSSPSNGSFGDRYVIQQRIAAGGMGTVHRGLDGRLGRPVAVKVLRDELVDDADFVERFRREARSAAMLSHPNIASIYDYIEEPGGRFIVMELLTGPDLARVLEPMGGLGLFRAVDVCRQVLAALQHAHERGVIHRDVKPANIVLDHDTRVKVTDFGIAQALGAARMTATGAFLGSAHYVAPERIKGEPAVPGSDLYSLGIVFYEMIVGHPPFRGDSLHEVLESRLRQDVPLPSESIRGLPEVVDEVVRGATARDPADRFPDARSMSDALAPLVPELRSPSAPLRLTDDTPPLPQTL